MTTLQGSKRDLTVSLGFFVVVLGAVAVSTLARGSTVVGGVFVVLTIGCIGLTIALHRQPPNELRFTHESIELARPGRTIGVITRADAAGGVEVRRHLYRGRAFWNLALPASPPRTGIPIDDFGPDDIRAAAEQHGWTVTIVE